MNTSGTRVEHPERQYLKACADLLCGGDIREGRNGTIYSGFGRQMRFDLREGFPLLTTKKVFWKAIVVELLWFLRGDTNIQYLHDHGVTIWDEWADENGDLGPVYGAQWRSWETPKGYVDQIAEVIEGLRNDPFGRRHVVSAWNPGDIPTMALPPCHCLFQFHVSKGLRGEPMRLNCQLYQRSADMFLGVPFNIASYALLTHLIAREVGMIAGEFIHTLGDYHLYENHLDQVATQIVREPRAFPTLVIDAPVWLGMGSLTPEMIQIDGYDPHPAIKGEVSR